MWSEAVGEPMIEMAAAAAVIRREPRLRYAGRAVRRTVNPHLRLRLLSPEEVQPFASHIVIGHGRLARRAQENISAILDRPFTVAAAH
jgi:hypothetical protein